MEGIKEAIAYITGLAVKAEKPETIEINGRTYCTKDLRRYDAADKAEPIKATTLTSLVDYIKESREELRDRMIIQVVSATKVLLYSGLLAERDRETLFEVNALLPQFEYGREYDQESFLVAMQSCFQKTDDREAVTIMASNIVNTQQGTFSDDGVSQQAIIKTGVTTKDAAFVPNPVSLIPYRTFLEVPQPASDFVFRISEGRGGAPAFKLVAADGGLWKSQAVDNVKNYLVKALADVPDREKITIIAQCGRHKCREHTGRAKLSRQTKGGQEHADHKHSAGPRGCSPAFWSYRRKGRAQTAEHHDRLRGRDRAHYRIK